MNCNVCTERYNRTSRRKVVCSSCEYECCALCLEKYLEVSRNQPQCMQCHRPWNHQYVNETFGASVVKRINDAKKEMLFEEQKGLFPHTQEYIRLTKEYNSVSDELKRMGDLMKDIKIKMTAMSRRQAVVGRLKHRIQIDFLRYCNRTTRTYVNVDPITQEEVVAEKVYYIRPCGKEDCKGFITNKGVCGLCRTEYCKKCMVEKSADHVCDENDVLSVEQIKKDSKPCPSCSTLIYRIDGCADMFCVSCFTAFNWNTLRIDRNGNSNPLYYRWIREGANMSNVRLDGCDTVHIYTVMRSNNYKNIATKEMKDALALAMQSLHHGERDGNRYYQLAGNTLRTNFETATLQVRAKYMMNESSLSNFKTQLMRINKAVEYNDNIEQSLNLVRGYRADMMRSIITDDAFEPKRYLMEYVTFAKYMNECIAHLRSVFYKTSSMDAMHDGRDLIEIPSLVKSILQTRD